MDHPIRQNSSLPIPGAAYIRFSSEMQNDSFSLDAQLRQIKEQAARDGVEIVEVFADPAQSAYRKRYRPGITAMREAARQGKFKILYVHKVDRLARRLEWSLEIVHELQSLDIVFKAVEQPFDLRTPEGKLLFHLVSSLGEFYSDNLSKETNKGKLESSLQGYHNGHVPWGYTSQVISNRKVGVPDPEKAPVVLELFERYATGLYFDMQLADWLNGQGYKTNRNQPFGKDTVRDILCNPYYVGKVRYRGMSVRAKGVSYRSTSPKVSQGQHQPIVGIDLWDRCQAIRASRRRLVKTHKQTARVYLLQELVVCAKCGRGLRAQTSRKGISYYREVSHIRGYRECPDAGHGVHVALIETQVSELIQSLRLPPDWGEAVRQMLDKQPGVPDPDAERREIRATLRLMRENYEHGLYEGDEFVYWQKVNELKEKMALLERIPEPAIHRAAQTLLDLRQSWEWATQEERKDLIHIMLQQVGCDVSNKCIQWIKVRPDFDVLFQLLANLRIDSERRYWIIGDTPG